jgi:hypothetical protein
MNSTIEPLPAKFKITPMWKPMNDSATPTSALITAPRRRPPFAAYPRRVKNSLHQQSCHDANQHNGSVTLPNIAREKKFDAAILEELVDRRSGLLGGKLIDTSMGTR